MRERETEGSCEFCVAERAANLDELFESIFGKSADFSDGSQGFWEDSFLSLDEEMGDLDTFLGEIRDLAKLASDEFDTLKAKDFSVKTDENDLKALRKNYRDKVTELAESLSLLITKLNTANAKVDECKAFIETLTGIGERKKALTKLDELVTEDGGLSEIYGQAKDIVSDKKQLKNRYTDELKSLDVRIAAEDLRRSSGRPPSPIATSTPKTDKLLPSFRSPLWRHTFRILLRT